MFEQNAQALTGPASRRLLREHNEKPTVSKNLTEMWIEAKHRFKHALGVWTLAFDIKSLTNLQHSYRDTVTGSKS